MSHDLPTEAWAQRKKNTTNQGKSTQPRFRKQKQKVAFAPKQRTKHEVEDFEMILQGYHANVMMHHSKEQDITSKFIKLTQAFASLKRGIETAQRFRNKLSDIKISKFPDAFQSRAKEVYIKHRWNKENYNDEFFFQDLQKTARNDREFSDLSEQFNIA